MHKASPQYDGNGFDQCRHFLDKKEVVIQMQMSELLNCKPLRRLEVQWFFCVLFSIIKCVLYQSLCYCFLNWMVEINFMEMYCQPAKNIFDATIFHCKKYFSKIKRTISDIHLCTLHSSSGIAGGTSWGRWSWTHFGRRINTLCSLSKTDFKTVTLTKNA